MSSREAVHHDRTIRTRSTPGQQTVQKVVRRKKRYVGRPKVRRPIRTPYIRDEEQKQKLIENILENVRIPIVKLNRIDTLTDDKIHKALTTDNDTGAISKKDISLEGEHTESDRTENESVQSDTRTVREFPILNNREAHRPSAWTRHTGGVGRQAAKAAQLAIKRELGKKRRRHESKQSLEPLLKSTTTDQSISISDKAADTEECVPQTEHDSNAAAETIEEEVRSDTNVKRVFSPVRKRRRPRIDLLVEQSIARSVKRRKVQPDKRSASKTSKVENVHSDLKIPLVKLEHVETARLVAKQKEKKLSSSLEENAFVEVQDDAMNGAIDPNIESDNNATALVARTDVPTTDENLRQRYSLFRDPKVLLPRLEILKDISRPDFSALEVENGLKTPISRTYRKRQPPQDSVSPSSRDLCREKQSSTVCSSITDPDQASNEATEEWERSISPRSHTSTLQSSPNRVTPRFRRQKKRENFSASRNLLESWLTSSNETPFEKGYGGSTVEKSSPQKSSRLPSLERSISPSSVVPDSQSSETLPNDLPEALPKTNSPKDDKETIPKDDAMEEMDQEDAISDSPGDTLALEPEEHSLPPPDDETTPSETVVTNETEATTNQITTEEEATESESGQQFSKSASIVDIGNLARQRESANPVSSNAPTINERSVYQSNQDVPKPVREERTIVLAKSPDDAVEEPKKTHQLDTVKESPKKDVKSYKCVVCDMTFEEYPLLRQHLSIHRKKQNTESGILLDLPSNVTNPKESTETNASDQDSDQVEEITKEGQTISEIAEPEDTASTVIVVEEDIEVDDSPVSCARTNIIVSFIQSDEKSRPCLVFKDQEKCDTLNDETKKSKRIWKELSSLSCTVCSTGFATKIDLAQHLYTHTESELLAAYEAAKEKLQPDRKKEKHKRRRKRDKSRKEEEKRESCVNPHIAALGSSSKDSTEETRPQEPAETSSPAKSTETSSPAKPVEPSSPVKSTETSSHVKPAESSPPIKSADNTAKKTAESASPAKLGQIESVRGVNTSPSNKETALQVDEARKLVTVCECHKNEVANKNCLKIEVVMLCQICRILYRTVECFETHYRCPEYTLCRDNRLHGRSPKLFCTKCALIFSSLQDLRHHLEQHARFNRNGTTDFRCNICKVIFIGIGSIFYAHWSTHLRNPFFLASRLTFPKTAIVSSTRSMQGPNDTQGYLQVAEYMCQLCKAHFSTQDELQNHETECTGRDIIETNAACASILKTPDKTTTSPRTARPATSPRTARPVTSPRTARPATVEEPTKPKIRMICGLCNDVFFDRSLLYQHTLKTHNQLVDPQYMCISLTAIKRIVVCSICATVCETMQEFNKHWAKHNVMQENFICVRCEKHYTSLETFLEHTSEHESGTKEDLPSCKVLYNGIEYSCEKCNVKFKTQQALSQHVVSHYKDYLSNENPKIPNAEGTIDDGDKARRALLDSEKQIAMEIDPHPAELLQRENNTATAKDATDLQSLNDATDLQSLNDANDLQSMNDINDLQSVNDANDSDDVTTISSVAASNAEVCEIRQPENEKSQTNPAESNVPSTEQTVAAIENVTACIGNLRTHETEPSTADVDSMEIIEEISLPSTIAESTDSEPGTSAKTAKTVSAAQAEVAQTEASTDDSCTKPKQGFLRVKNMSELMAKPFGCSRCVKAFATTDELVQHTKSHEGIDDSVIVIDDTDDPAELWTSNAAPTNTNTSTANTIRPLATATNEPSTSTAGNAATEPQRKYVLLPLKVNKLKHVPVPAKTLVPVTQAAKSGSGGAAGGQAPAGEKSSPTTAYHKNLQVYSNVIRPNLSTLRIAQRKNSPNTTSVASSTTSSTVASTEASATSNTANQLENSSTNVAPKPRLAPHILRRRSSSPSTKLLASNRPPGAVGTPPATRSSSPSTKLLASNRTPGSVGTPPATTLPTGTEERPNTPIGIGEKHVCMVCPDFSCSKLTEYLLHEISEEHMKRKDKVMRQNMIGTYPSQYQNNYLNTSGGVTLVAEPPNVNAPNVSTVGQAQQLQLHQQQAQLQHQQQQQFQHQQQQQIQCQRQYQRQILPQGYRQPIHPQQQQQVQPQQQRQLTLYAPQQPQQQLKPQQSQQQQQQQRQQFQQFYAVPISEPVVIMQQPYVVQQQQDWTARPSYNVSSNLIPHSSNARPATVVNAQYQIPVSTAAPTLNLNPLRTTTASVCSYCPKNVRFGSEELLQYHINVDHNFLCDICGQRLFNVNELDVHRIKHDLIWSANAFQRNQLEK